MNKIYKIYSFRSKNKEPSIGSLSGFYFNLDDAYKAVAENRHDFADNWFDYCCIYESVEGVCCDGGAFDKTIQWFKLTGPKGGTYDKFSFKKCEKPKFSDYQFGDIL